MLFDFCIRGDCSTRAHCVVDVLVHPTNGFTHSPLLPLLPLWPRPVPKRPPSAAAATTLTLSDHPAQWANSSASQQMTPPPLQGNSLMLTTDDDPALDVNEGLEVTMEGLFEQRQEQPETWAADLTRVEATQPSPTQSALHDFYNDKFLDELTWDFNNPDQLSLQFNDSGTLPSARTSYEYRTSSEVFDTLSQFEDDTPLSTASRGFRTSISNSLSSIFKSNNPNRFNLRGMNPLSAHKDAQLVVQTLPTLADSVEDMSIEHEDEQQVKKPKQCNVLNNEHLKNCQCHRRNPSRTQSLVNAISSARLGFNKQPPQVSHPIAEERVSFEFDEELTKVISMASMNSSSYNFNTVPALTDSSLTPMDMDIDVQEVGGDDSKKDSPDYAALFSDVKTSKKRTNLFRGPFTRQAQDSKQVLEPLSEGSQPSGSAQSSALDVPVSGVDTARDLVPVEVEPPRRGRKPTLEYDPAKQFVCSYCRRRFKRQEHLKRHVRSLHTNEKPYDCELCGKKFSRTDNLAQHVRTHALEGEVQDHY